MLELLINYGFFVLKTLTIIAAIITVLMVFFLLLGRQQDSLPPLGQIEITEISDILDDYQETLLEGTLSIDAYKKHLKQKKKEEKAEKKQSGKTKDSDSTESEARLFVLEFDGDIEASATSHLKESITAVLSVATPKDEVLLILESSGGYVHTYGLAASQLARFRNSDIPLTIAVDKVAASGGYLMACVANKILAAPFAIIGSIGVMAELPNFHRLMEKHDIDYEMHTAGKYKRTLSMFGKNSMEGRKKFIEELDDVHGMFKQHISTYRECDIEKIATGEHWHGQQALELNLVDELKTSDEYIQEYHHQAKGRIFKIEYSIPESWIEKLRHQFAFGISQGLNNVLQKILNHSYSKM